MKYLIKNRINPKLTLCTDGEFYADGFFGPGHRIGAKIYTNKKAAEKRGIVEEYERSN